VILGFAHPAIVVPNLEAAREFYEKMFGFRVIGSEGWQKNPTVDKATGMRGSACKGYMMAGHNCCLELFEFSEPQPTAPPPGALGAHEPGIRHLSFYVDDCHYEYQRLINLGGTPLGEPVDLGDGIHAVYCHDPFGNIIELCNIASEPENPVNLPGISQLDAYQGPSA
jgi:catechol 2,3-dioxygenase-like lactoylglutathione lyase family enzyme